MVSAPAEQGNCNSVLLWSTGRARAFSVEGVSVCYLVSPKNKFCHAIECRSTDGRVPDCPTHDQRSLDSVPFPSYECFIQGSPAVRKPCLYSFLDWYVENSCFIFSPLSSKRQCSHKSCCSESDCDIFSPNRIKIARTSSKHVTVSNGTPSYTYGQKFLSAGVVIDWFDSRA